jgi:hypothetical protein
VYLDAWAQLCRCSRALSIFVLSHFTLGIIMPNFSLTNMSDTQFSTFCDTHAATIEKATASGMDLMDALRALEIIEVLKRADAVCLTKDAIENVLALM